MKKIKLKKIFKKITNSVSSLLKNYKRKVIPKERWLTLFKKAEELENRDVSAI